MLLCDEEDGLEFLPDRVIVCLILYYVLSHVISSLTVAHCEAVVHTSMTVTTLLSPAAAAFMGGSAYPTLSRTSRSALKPLYAISPATLAAV